MRIYKIKKMKNKKFNQEVHQGKEEKKQGSF